MKKVILFDLDDTLYKELDFVYGGFKEVCWHLANKYDKDEEELYKYAIDVLNNQGRGKIFNTICEQYNIQEDINKLIKIYREAKPQISLYDDAEYILKYLKLKLKNDELIYMIDNMELPCGIGIITDGKASVQWNKIKLLGLEKMVDKIIVTDDYGVEFWKPNEFAYIEMLKYFNCKKDESLYIGDNPNKDFIGARKVGMKTIRIIRDIGDHMNTFLEKEYEADFVVRDLREILKYICSN
jgi:Predicted hydrolase (HAD superfamily)